MQTEFQFESGIPGGTLPGKYQAIEVAKMHGYTTDRWARDQRAEIEVMLEGCPGSDVLIKLLKGENGLYTEFAVHLISEKQRLSSSKAPVFKAGELVLDRNGVAKLQKQKPIFTASEFGREMAEIYGKYFTEEDSDDIFSPVFPPGTNTIPPGATRDYPGVLEIEVVDIVIPSKKPTVLAEWQDVNRELGYHRDNTFLQIRAARREMMEAAGDEDAQQDAAVYMSAYSKSFNGVFAQQVKTPQKAKAPSVKRSKTTVGE